jgi:hypothetical protein
MLVLCRCCAWESSSTASTTRHWVLAQKTDKNKNPGQESGIKLDRHWRVYWGKLVLQIEAVQNAADSLVVACVRNDAGNFFSC